MEPILALPGFHEPFSSLLHLLAAAFVMWRGVALVRSGSGLRDYLGLGAFVVGATLMLALSGTYHLLDPALPARDVLQRLDHAGIWMMIAGSFSAVHAVAFRGVWRWGFLAVVWAVATTGLVLTTVFFDTLPESLGLSLYLGMGWLGIATVVQTWRRARWQVARLLVFSGVAYSLGALYDFFAGPSLIPGVVGAHEVFHVGVILGIIYHWRFVQSLITGLQERSFTPRLAVHHA
jgi:channel protein (hemolysin III family)